MWSHACFRLTRSSVCDTKLGRMWTLREKLHQWTFYSQRLPLVSILVANALRSVCGGLRCSSREESRSSNRTMANSMRTCGRGILRFTSLEPCRLPGQRVALNGVSKREESMDNSRVQNGGETHVPKTPGTADILLSDFLTFLLTIVMRIWR